MQTDPLRILHEFDACAPRILYEHPPDRSWDVTNGLNNVHALGLKDLYDCIEIRNRKSDVI